ncbi:MAG: hypothetical protein H0X24_06340 [Ktedonobacterales bacterium]|nr:hypothetical protein [Ktedonobacterales bacterium]
MASLYPMQSCHECEAEAAGRCPSCNNPLCMEHFARHAHTPCARHLAQHHDEYLCYVCGANVVPEQWSTAVFAHYVDEHKCFGCNRYICDTHTQRRDEQVKIVQDGLRGHRYHLTARSCELCAPLRPAGGLIGVGWWAAGVATLALTGWFLIHG